MLSSNLLGKDASADVLRGSEKTHSGQDVPEACDVVTMSDVGACAKALVQRVAEGGLILAVVASDGRAAEQEAAK